MSNTPSSRKRRPDSLKIITWNANSIRDKKLELIHFIQQHKPDVLLFQETFLKPQINFSIPNYTTYRSDRLTGRGGGTAITINKNIDHSHLPNLPTQHIEHTTIQIITSDNTPLIITSAYLSPLKPLLDQDLNLLLHHTARNVRIIVGGDLNARHFAWHSYSQNNRGRTLHQHQDHHNYAIVAPADPTHFPSVGHPSTLDIYLMKNIITTYTVHTEEALSSDHYPVILIMDNWQSTNTNHYKRNTNWSRYAEIFKNSNIETPNIANEEELQQEVDRVTSQILNTSNNCTTITHKKGYHQQFPDELIELIKTKNKAYKLARRTLYPPHKQAANNLKNQVQIQIKQFRNDQWALLLTNLDEDDPNKNTWTTLRILKNKTTYKNYPIQGPNGPVFTANEKANVLADSLQNRFTPNDIPPPPNHNPPPIIPTINQFLNNPPPSPPIRPVTLEELSTEIARLNPKKAPGPDSITNKHIKMLPPEYLPTILNLINSITSLAIFPPSWKHANIITFPKPKQNPTLPTNHRPISLLNSLSKLTERFILNRTKEENDRLQIIPNIQFGFTEAHSTEQQALKLTEIIYSAFAIHYRCSAVMLDIAAAFDTVWHQALIYKLITLQVNSQLIQLIISFLQDRTFAVRLNNQFSTTRPISAGVPQGAVLSPILYNLYTSDIPSTIPNTHVLTFADDTAIISTSKYHNKSRSYLQTAIDIFQHWSAKWKIKINQNKCQAIHFSTRKPTTLPDDPILINNHPLPWNPTAKYLGVRFDSRLTWSNHIHQIIDKMETRYAQHYALLCYNSQLSVANKLKIYRACFIPIMTYASTCWSQVARTHLNTLESTQAKILRRITNSPWFIKNKHIRRDTKIKPITEVLQIRNKKKITQFLDHPNITLTQQLQYPIDEEGPPRKRPKYAMLYEPP